MHKENVMSKPKVFIGSSTKGLNIARLIQEILNEEEVVIHTWKDDVFKHGEATLQSLIRALDRYDFAIFVFTPDDLILKLESGTFSPRDNVLFETGLFMGKLGPYRTFTVLDLQQKVTIPTDLSGITFAIYTEPNSEDIPRGKLAPPCNMIRRTIEDLGPINRDRQVKELGSLYRLLNACTFPHYDDVKTEFLDKVNYRTKEEFRYINEVFDFLGDLLSDYVYPLLEPKELRALRIYFAYYLGDGVRVLSPEKTAIYCIDKDKNGEDFKGQFVIGMSNTSGFSEKNWREGRPISGYEGGSPTSNCASVFQQGIARYRRDLSRPSDRVNNFEVREELSVYTVPVEWRTHEGNARIGVLAVSSRNPNFIPDSLRVRVELLGHLIGFLVSLYAAENLTSLDQEASNYPQEVSLPLGFSMREGVSADRFIQRVVALRRQIASHFEENFLRQGIHAWDGDELRVVLLDR
jgi:Predicted nucleotide-binding protein containing TIR-like domain